MFIFLYTVFRNSSISDEHVFCVALHFTIGHILFFETDGEKIYGHTKDEAYEVKQKLYELEELLPIAFCRISKSTIVNAKQIYSLEKSFSGTSTVNFYQTHKQVHVSRRYYQVLKERLNEMR